MAPVNPTQFHEMTRGEFESQPGTTFHGNPSGNFNADQPRAAYGFHVGSKRAAEEAVTSRAHFGSYSGGERIPLPLKGHRKGVEIEAHADTVRGGRITAPMVNYPYSLGSYGKGDFGDMNNSGDVLANGKAREIHSKGQKMRRGIYYVNASEDAGSVSAVLPGRQFWKTHEDHLVEAREQGKKIPNRAAEGYKHIPGQQVMF